MDKDHFLVSQSFSAVKEFFRCDSSSVQICHVNIRSIRKYWDQFLALTSSFRTCCEVFVLTEINVPLDTLCNYTLPGYQVYSYLRPIGKGGGIAVFIKNTWLVSEITFSFTQAEVVSLRLCSPLLSLVLIAVYRPPCCNGRIFLQELNVAISSLLSGDNICMTGDINIDTLRPNLPLTADYLDVLSKWGLDCTISKPTREEFLSSKLVTSCLDHINVRVHDFQTLSAVIETKLADHYFVACSLSPKSSHVRRVASKTTISVIDPRALDREIAQYDWHNFICITSPSNMYEKFVTLLDEFKKTATRIVKVRQTNSNEKWMTKEILVAIKEKDMLWARAKRAPQNAILRASFKQSRNKVNAMIRLAKRNHMRNKFEDARFDSRKTWSLINGMRGSNVQSSKDQYFFSNFSGDGLNIANTFNDFFSRVTGVARSTPGICTLQNSIAKSAYLPPLIEGDLKSILFALKANKSPGHDGISINVLRRNFDHIKAVLLSILNHIIESGIIPIQLKKAIVFPLFKSGSRNKIENNRTISVLSCIVQILEKHILNVMTSFLSTHDVFSHLSMGLLEAEVLKLCSRTFLIY